MPSPACVVEQPGPLGDNPAAVATLYAVVFTTASPGWDIVDRTVAGPPRGPVPAARPPESCITVVAG